METIKYFLIGTPWYVYLIFFYLVIIGIKSVKGGIVSLKKLFFIPCVFLFMSIDEIVTKLPFHAIFIGAFAIGLACGTLLGYWQYKSLKIDVDQNKKLLKIGGSKFSLVLIIVTFSYKYYLGYTFAVNPNMELTQMALLLYFSSILTGMFVGRLLFALHKLKHGPHINLTVQL